MIIPPHLSHLPPPSLEAQTLSDQLSALIAQEIMAADGWISFARYMELTLYAPGLGYYSAGSRKLGASGDFVTAPEMSPLFARCIARQLAQLHGEGLHTLLEIGAGSGALAAELLLEMDVLACVPESYLILELSGDLRERQKAMIAQRAPALLHRVHWLDVLPRQFAGVILANEMLDATPVHRVHITEHGVEEIGVGYSSDVSSPLSLQGGELAQQARGHWDGGGVRSGSVGTHPHPNPPPEGAGKTLLSAVRLTPFMSAPRPATGKLLTTASQLTLPPEYQTEINFTARALVTSLTRLLTRGIMLFIDYGFPVHEFYHPQRNSGTLMCHYRHHAHDDPFAFVGLQDITAHVDFSAMADAAHRGGANLLGYATQAQFLINCGITDLLSAVPASDTRAYAPLAAQAQKLLSPAEMGELFKVIALGKNVDISLLGFVRGDKSHTL